MCTGKQDKNTVEDIIVYNCIIVYITFNAMSEFSAQILDIFNALICANE